MTIVVTGATGNLGGLVVDALLRDGVEPGQIVAAGRSPERLAALGERGVRTAVVDFDDRSSVDAALAGADRLLLVSGSEFGRRVAQHATVIDAAKDAGVELVAYTSALGATTSALVVAPEHKGTEEYLVASGLPYVMLRNGWYHENYLGAAAAAAESGVVLTSAGEGRVASAARSDYADAAAAVLREDGHAGRVYELTGDEAWTFQDFAELVAELSGRPVRLRSVSPAEHAAVLAEQGVDEGSIGFAIAMDGNIRDGLLGGVDGSLSRLIGRPRTPLRDILAPLF